MQRQVSLSIQKETKKQILVQMPKKSLQVIEDAQEVLPFHILLEGITQAGGPGHDPEPDPGPGLGLTGEDRGLIPTPTDQDQNQDQDPWEDVVTIPEAVVIPDLQTTSAQNRTLSPHKRNIKFDRS